MLYICMFWKWLHLPQNHQGYPWPSYCALSHSNTIIRLILAFKGLGTKQMLYNNLHTVFFYFSSIWKNCFCIFSTSGTKITLQFLLLLKLGEISTRPVESVEAGFQRQGTRMYWSSANTTAEWIYAWSEQQTHFSSGRQSSQHSERSKIQIRFVLWVI